MRHIIATFFLALFFSTLFLASAQVANYEMLRKL